MKQKMVIGVVALGLLVTALVSISGAPTASASRSCSNFTVDNQVADVSSYWGYDYILSRSGAVYAPCGLYYGGANGQGYFSGRTAAFLDVCGVNGQPVGYQIIATSGERYTYGRYYSCSTIVWQYGCADYWLAAPVTDVTSRQGESYILTTDGAVFGHCAPYFGGTNGQGYFSGRTADYLDLCWDGGVVGYTVVATSNERYSYGRTTGCR